MVVEIYSMVINYVTNEMDAINTPRLKHVLHKPAIHRVYERLMDVTYDAYSGH
jgi:hypothetical protein